MKKFIEKDLKNKLTKKDYFFYLINKNSFIVMSPLIIVALIVVFIFTVDKNGFNYSDLVYLLPILLFVLSFLQMGRAVNNAVKSNADSGDLKIILEENKYREITSNGENSLQYNKFHSFYSNKNYYYLYVDKINALILPKREFSSDELSTIDTYFSKSMKRNSFLNARTIFGIIFSLGLIICIGILIGAML
jgi:hypothetical protein